MKKSASISAEYGGNKTVCRLLKGLIYAGVATTGIVVHQVSAVTYSANGVWSNGPSAGQPAASCSIIIPDDRPLVVPRTFVVGRDVPDGTEIFSWGYGEAFSDFIVSCISSGIGGANGDINMYAQLNLFSSPSSSGYIPLSDSGFGLKLWGRFNTDPGYDYSACGGVSVNCQYYTTSFSYPFTSNPAANTEIELTPIGGSLQAMTQMTQKYRIAAPPAMNQLFPTHTGSFSVRMALVKIGTPQYNGAVKTLNSAILNARANLASAGGNYTVNGLLDGSGITIVPPACQLRTTDYIVPMGRWAADTITYLGGPAYGPYTPVNISIECSGKVEHVQFRFEDAGASLSANKNISLYDSAGGNKVDGLEIELLYNGTKVNVDNATLTDTGSHGSFVSSLPVFDSASTAVFQARYVQSSAITRAGTNFIGPVTGKVNMYVTYY
ncbi:fimbrial protein [Klebsiella michiganensis]|uniref:fimbrial protein n=1 Tax=Klebsiella michiganensis TaxID=1134687 RepID=UPI003D988108